MADLIPGAKFVELPGEDHLPFVGDAGLILDHIEEFLTGRRHAPAVDRVLATVLCIRVEAEDGATWEQFQSLVGREAALFRGDHLTVADRSILLTFDGPARAVRAGYAILGLADRLAIGVRCGVDTGMCEVGQRSLEGVAVDTARRVCGTAAFAEVLVTESVMNLVSGSGLVFVPKSGNCGIGGETLRVFQLVESS